jgi:ketopantoate reductase
MLNDVQMGTPTQVRYGLGYLLQIGRSYGFRMPTTLALWRAIRAREVSSRAAAKYVKT